VERCVVFVDDSVDIWDPFGVILLVYVSANCMPYIVPYIVPYIAPYIAPYIRPYIAPYITPYIVLNESTV